MINKYTYNDVKYFIENEGFSLLSKIYKNNKEKLEIKCNNNHMFQMRYDSFKRNRKCPICSGKQKHTYEYVKNYIENVKYHQLISTEYINNKIKLTLVCPSEHQFEMTFHDFQQGVRCPLCSNNKKHTYNEVKYYIEHENYQLLSTEYKNVVSKLSIKCDKGHIFNMDYNHFLRGQRCPICSGKQKHTYEYVKNYIEINRYKLISTEYKNAFSILEVQCDKGHIYKTKFNYFQQGRRCPTCNQSEPEKEIIRSIKQYYSDVILENDRTTLRNPLTNKMLELDIFLPKLNKAIEFNGIHWHSSKYSKWKDKQKITQCRQKNINLLVIEEKDWIKDKLCCLNKTKKFLKGEINV